MAQLTKKIQPQLLLISLTLIAVDLGFQSSAFDPISPTKFWMIGLVSAWAASQMFTSHTIWSRIRKEFVFKGFTLFGTIFLISFFIAYSRTDVKSIGLIGDSGRNLGFLNYLFLILIALYSSLQLGWFNIQSLYITALILGPALSLYGLLQFFKINLFADWQAPYNPVILMVGNPDFAASLLAILFILNFTHAFIRTKVLERMALLAVSLFIFVVILLTRATQGLLLSLAGVALFVLVLIWKRNRKLGKIVLLVELFSGLIVLLGTLNMGPLSHLLYKASVRDRGYDWRAAIGMFKSHPLFGVGVDRYNAYFMQYRDAKYPLLFGYQQTVNNAHNVFLELFATAGVFVGITYIILIVFIGYRGLMAVRGKSGYQAILVTGIFAAWFVTILQNVISIDITAISIWSWILGGALVALSISTTSNDSELGRSELTDLPQIRYRRRHILGVAVFGVLLVGLLSVVLPMTKNETQIKKFPQIIPLTTERDRAAYLNFSNSVFNQRLLNPAYKYFLATQLVNRNYGPEAISYLKKTISADDRYSNADLLLALLYEHFNDYASAIISREHERKYDPYNAESLVILANDYIHLKKYALGKSVIAYIQQIAPGTEVAARAKMLKASL
jgi:O-antigen ligase